MELWEQAIEYKERALKERNKEVVIELYDKAVSLWHQMAEQDKTERARYMLSASSFRMEAAEIAKAQGYTASYHSRIGLAHTDKAFYPYYLAWASDAVGDLDDALSGYKEALSILKTAFEHFNKSLQIEFSRERKANRKACLEYMKWCRAGIQAVKFKMRVVR